MFHAIRNSDISAMYHVNWNKIAPALNSFCNKIHQMISITSLYMYRRGAENIAPEKNYTFLLLSRTWHCPRQIEREKSVKIDIRWKKKEGKKKRSNCIMKSS